MKILNDDRLHLSIRSTVVSVKFDRTPTTAGPAVCVVQNELLFVLDGCADTLVKSNRIKGLYEKLICAIVARCCDTIEFTVRTYNDNRSEINFAFFIPNARSQI
jgi:hypothetical protein